MTVSHLLGAASAAALLAASGMSHTASAASLIFSTEQPEAVDGPNGTTTRFADDDFVRYDLDTQIGVIEITGSDINPDPLAIRRAAGPQCGFCRGQWRRQPDLFAAERVCGLPGVQRRRSGGV